MPRRTNVDLRAELGEDIDLTEDEANAAREIIAPVVVVPAPVAVSPSAPLSVTLEQLQALMASATAGSAASTAALAQMVTQGIAQAHKPVPEGTDQSNPRISDQNPLGDRDHPRPALKCEVFLGTQDGKTQQIARTYPFDGDDLTVSEIMALNTLESGNFSVKLHDGTPIKVSVVPEYDDATDALRRLVIVVPGTVTGKNSQLKNMLPGPCNLVSQITGGRDFSRVSNDDLAWFMAEHRKKNYVAVREAVTA